ncbi:MAG: hypothetical protein KJ072_05595 [Verrucomicrobia bacterium]|nr:hypothetical protein [Verrucomicrobiota bacterium]
MCPIYDWGNGAAAEAANRILDRYGHVYLDRRRSLAFGVDTVRVRPVGRGWKIVNLDDTPRLLRVVSDDGKVREGRLEKSLRIR